MRIHGGAITKSRPKEAGRQWDHVGGPRTRTGRVQLCSIAELA
jgi:hypothetical protein